MMDSDAECDINKCAKCNEGFLGKKGKTKLKCWSTEPSFGGPLAEYEKKQNVKYPRPSVFCCQCRNRIIAKILEKKCARCNVCLEGKKHRKPKQARSSTETSFVAPLAYYEMKYKVKYPQPSSFCTKCRSIIVSIFEGHVPKSVLCRSQCNLKHTPEENAETFSGIGNLEDGYGGFHGIPTTGGVPAENAEGRYQCILCNNEGIPLENKETNRDELVLFVLRYMLEIPGNRLQDLTIDQPTTRISSCAQCKTLILKAFHTKRTIEKLETELRGYQTLAQEKVKRSWNNGEITMETSLRRQPISIQSRCYVSREEWPELELPMEVSLPGEDSLDSSHPSIKAEHEESDADNDPLEEKAIEPSCSISHNYNPKKPKLNRGNYRINEKFSFPTEDNDSVYDPTMQAPAKMRKMIGNRHPSTTSSRKSNQERMYRCKMCPSKPSMQLRTFIQHLLYHMRRPFKCQVCGIFFTGDPLEFEHFPHPTPPDDDTALVHKCSPETLEKVKFRLHPNWACQNCPETFHLEEERDHHFQTKHPNSSKPELLHFCPDCPKQYSEFEDWQIHRTLEHPQISQVSCFYCPERFEITTTNGVSFPDNKLRSEHMLACHEIELNNTPFPYPECEFCGDQFLGTKSLQDHVQSRHCVAIQKKASCPYCFIRRQDHASVKHHVLQIHNPVREKIVCISTST